MPKPTLERGPVEILWIAGKRAVMAWRHQDFAIYRDGEWWFITILPLGMCLPTSWAAFRRMRNAVAAMAEIARLRNDWSVITQADLTVALGEQLREICARHNASVGEISSIRGLADRHPVTGGPLKRRPNGYQHPDRSDAA